ncbi:hypothetical protein ACP70R_045376 [Stipagrostis hirtigluma subsp. patula]
MIVIGKLLAPGTGNYIGGEEFDLTANLDTPEDLKIFSKKDWSKYVCNKIRSALEKFHDTEIKETTSSVFVPGCGVVLLILLLDNLIYVDTPKEYKTFGICHYTSKDVQALMDKHNILSLLSGTRVDEKPQRRIVEKVVSSRVRRVRKPCVKKFDTGTHEAGKVCIPDDLPSFMREFGDAMSKAESFIKKGKALVANHVEEVSKGKLSESDAKPSKEPPVPSEQPPQEIVFERRKTWYKRAILDREHLTKQTGKYIVLMLHGFIVREYQFVQEFKPKGLLSNEMMELICKCYNEFQTNSLLLEIPVVNDLLNRRTGDRLEKMLSPKNLEGKNMIFIPVLDVKMEHWFMVVIDISNKLKYVLDSLTPKTPNPLSIVVLESLEGHLKTAGYDISEYKAIYPIVAPQHNIPLLECPDIVPDFSVKYCELKAKDIKSVFGVKCMCEGPVVFFFLKCLQNYERKFKPKVADDRLILEPFLVALLSDFQTSGLYSGITVLKILSSSKEPQQFQRAKHIMLPVYHEKRWTLYNINFHHKPIDILDSLGCDANTKKYHSSFCRLLMDRLYAALTVFTGEKVPDFSAYRFAFVKVPLQIVGSNDCAFHVMNFLYSYNPYTLKLMYTLGKSEEFRPKFLHFMLFHEENSMRVQMPSDIQTLRNLEDQ